MTPVLHNVVNSRSSFRKPEDLKSPRGVGHGTKSIEYKAAKPANIYACKFLSQLDTNLRSQLPSR
eukprot:CAMPEP_0183791296 /NCGR_PEP_ID=MMETSP0803_2-20130417/1740_1 /TAXON_ID=195967 /ORGANISM="Crustomastix stigmata, Strain CCMP3273" /LENGTH=64 /DNA_ID=CAMNT_0026035595 /DNA_START=267 /DNA_END=458 /DNA_ORIENTATION=+